MSVPTPTKPNLEDIDIELSKVADPEMRRVVVVQLNVIEKQSQVIRSLEDENSWLREENARLKGEQGRGLKSKSKTGKAKVGNISSEAQRKKGKKGKKRKRKKKEVVIDRTERCAVDREALPADAVYKGIETTVIQDVVFTRSNVAFEREKFYSPSLGKTYLGPMPPGYAGHRFGPGVRALVLMLYYETGTSEPKILDLLAYVGVEMSAGELSNLLIHDVRAFHEEKGEVLEAGLESSPWQQIDDTGTQVGGVNHHCHILCNPLYTIYQTMPRKDRPTVLSVLRGTDSPHYLVNEQAVALAAQLGVSGAVLSYFQERMPWKVELAEDAFDELYNEELGWIGGESKRKLYEAAALASYRAQGDVPHVRTLLGDDARQFDDVTEERALCWIHDGRLYAKLTPHVSQFREELDSFLDRYWDYYRELRSYRSAPEAEESARLRKAFDDLFSTVVAYDVLADRIAKTLAKKDELLLVLDHPELPLHNNASELGARGRARKRDVSLCARTTSGVKAWDTFQSLVATAKKLGVNVYEYFTDRVRGTCEIPPLAELIRERAAPMKLGESWAEAPIT